MEKTKATIETLNDLVQINNDRIRGFERALKNLTDDDAGIRYFCINCIAESHRFKMELGTEIEALSKHKDIDNTTTVLGTLHRNWLQLKAKFTAYNTKNVLEECEFGEDAILKAYKTALEQEYLPAYIRDMLVNQQAILQESHDEIKSLRDHA